VLKVLQNKEKRKRVIGLNGRFLIYYPGKSLTAFQSGDLLSKNHIIFIGGLTDGFMSLPYLEKLSSRLEDIHWSLIQVLLSSSYSGYGTSSLFKDVEELDVLAVKIPYFILSMERIERKLQV